VGICGCLISHGKRTTRDSAGEDVASGNFRLDAFVLIVKYNVKMGKILDLSSQTGGSATSASIDQGSPDESRSRALYIPKH
jgi:hypothetical protein